MGLKIKVQPQDFIVEEISSLPLEKKGDFGVYILKKRGWNTTDLLHSLVKKLNTPYGNFSYGGRKDKYALTSQHITIKGQGGFTLKEESYSLEFVGFMQRPMGPDLIKGNKFKIAARRLSDGEAKNAVAEIETVNSIGYPNYFDDQRFGSYDPDQGFLAQKLLQGHFNGALKIYLTFIHPHDKKEARQRKQIFRENWRNWQACRKIAKTGFEKIAFDWLVSNPNRFLPMLRKIPREDMTLFFSVYQSYIWNETLRKIINAIAGPQIRISKGIAGDYIFYTRLKDKDYKYLKGLSFPIPSSKAIMPQELVRKTYEAILEINGIRPSMFNNIKVRQAFFKSVDRKAIVFPENLTFETAKDELYPGKQKLCLKFSLPRGSFATMLVKRLFCEKPQA
jgi:tRNA pseudouridine13 synthase